MGVMLQRSSARYSIIIGSRVGTCISHAGSDRAGKLKQDQNEIVENLTHFDARSSGSSRSFYVLFDFSIYGGSLERSLWMLSHEAFECLTYLATIRVRS